MATTTNFGWTTPDDTALVKDGASAIRTLGTAVDSSMVGLKGGTTGQILSKTSNTDMAFTWINNDVGDITAVNVSSPITGGGTTGAVTISIQDATTAQKGAVQLTDSTSSTSITTAATPNSVKTAWDLANAAIAKLSVDAKGDLLVGTADNTIDRLSVGANNTVLIADSSTTTGLKWGLPIFRGVSCTKSANQSTTQNTFTSITFDTEDYDSDGFHSISTNTSRITIPSGLGGKYRFSGVVSFAASSTGTRQARLIKNGTTTYNLVQGESNGSGTLTTTFTFNYILDLAATDYVEVQTNQGTAGSLNVVPDTVFQAEYLGA